MPNTEQLLLTKYNNFCKLRAKYGKTTNCDWDFIIAMNQLIEELRCHLPQYLFDILIKYDEEH